MLNPKKAIPKLAVAALALTGCGGDGNGTGSDGDTLGDALQAFCVKLVDCFPGYYQGGVNGCVNELAAYYGLDMEVSAACEAAGISYFQCGTQLSCAELDAAGNSCDDEFYAAYAACT